MDSQAQADLIGALRELSQVRRAIQRAEAMRQRAQDRLDGLGFPRRAVERALDLLDCDPKASHDEMRAAQKLLASMRAPVQLEFVGMHESDLHGAAAIDAIEDEGFWAAMCGSSRTYQARSADERAAWMRGFDAAAELMSHD